MGNQASVNAISFETFLRILAAARIMMPESFIRLSAGRRNLTLAQQLLSFKVGANSLFLGGKLLTAPNLSENFDTHLLDCLKKAQPPQPSTSPQQPA